MPAAIDLVRALQERLSHETNLPLRSVTLTPVDARELQALEAKLGRLLPEAYLQFIAKHGLVSATTTFGRVYARMLSPAEVLDRHEWSQELIEEGAFGDEEDELEAARLEHEVRSRLIPFQYMAESNVSDYYCFAPGMRRDAGPLIFPARHDDFELAPWLLDANPVVSGCTFDFDEHLAWVLRAGQEEGDWGR
jgi:hypothetical protein